MPRGHRRFPVTVTLYVNNLVDYFGKCTSADRLTDEMLSFMISSRAYSVYCTSAVYHFTNEAIRSSILLWFRPMQRWLVWALLIGEWIMLNHYSVGSWTICLMLINIRKVIVTYAILCNYLDRTVKLKYMNYIIVLIDSSHNCIARIFKYGLAMTSHFTRWLVSMIIKINSYILGLSKDHWNRLN